MKTDVVPVLDVELEHDFKDAPERCAANAIPCGCGCRTFVSWTTYRIGNENAFDFVPDCTGHTVDCAFQVEGLFGKEHLTILHLSGTRRQFSGCIKMPRYALGWHGISLQHCFDLVENLAHSRNLKFSISFASFKVFLRKQCHILTHAKEVFGSTHSA